jgi:hypothetical protein
LKSCDFWTDTGEGFFELCYLRDKQKNEIDFLITKDKKPWIPVEVKWADTEPSPAWKRFLPQIKVPFAVQVVASPNVWRWTKVQDTPLLIASAEEFLLHWV